MVWSTTTAVGEFLAEAGEFLRAEPALNIIILTGTETLRGQAAARPPSSLAPPAAVASSGGDRTRLGYRPVADRIVLSC